ncbi:MAG TPA: transporter substrate-binding domain-containing protein [Gammaproteobacteria bacterium]|nr:transporter substrate-binding domain-containing protein [Gammaproteobacteria bacterium]
MQKLPALLLLIASLVSITPTLATHKDVAHIEQVKLQLNSTHQFRFAGYYMAIEKGFYKDKGIEVQVLESSHTQDSIEELVDGHSNYAISGADALIAKTKSLPIVALAAINHESPLALMVRKDSGIKTPGDLRGKKIMLGETNKFAIVTMLKNAGVSVGEYEILPIISDHTALDNNQIDAYAAYITDKAYHDRNNISMYHYIRPKDYDLDFYNDILITTHTETTNNRFRVRDFRDASLEGWKYALSNIDETVGLILDKYNSLKLDRSLLTREAQELRKIIRPLQTEIGSMKESYWQFMLDTFIKAGFAPKEANIDNFIYKAKDHELLDYLNLTTDERVWLRQHWNQIRIGVNPDWFPIEFGDQDGNHAGISSDIIKRIGQDLKIYIKSAQGLTPAKALEKLKNKELDVLPASIKTKEMEGDLLFSEPYMNSDWVVISSQDHPELDLTTTIDKKKVYSLEPLFNQTVAVTNGYISHQRLKDNWPAIDLAVKRSVLDTLRAVSSGEANFAIVDLETATPLLHSYQMTDLKVNTPAFDVQDGVYFAVRNDWPELVSIINKELDYIGQTEIDRIKNKWRSVPVSLGIQKSDVFIIIGIALLIITIIFIWAFTIRRAKTKVELLLQKETDLLVSNSRHIVMGEMISMLVHQWKQPLTSMMLGIEIIKMKLAMVKVNDSDKEFLDKQFGKVEDMLDEQNKLISDLRNFFHPDKHKEGFNLLVCIEGATSMLAGVINKHSINIKLNIDSSIELIGYERELKHVFINLIKNAVDELIDSKIKDPTICISNTMTDGVINIEVQDNGNGIKEEILPTIFEAYVSSKALNGTGLGLYMGRLVIEEHFSGSIQVRNCTVTEPCTYGASGACFMIQIPTS